MKIHPYYFSSGKRVFDVVLAVSLVVMLSPIWLMVGGSVLLAAGSPILYLQPRVGRHGRIFTLWKFRTMRRNAEKLKQQYQYMNEAPPPMFKIHNDPRFVGFGKILAQTGLDELPQLINILIGDMSFVGPRPLPVGEAKKLSPQWRAWREQVRPGVFSQWALSEERHQSLKQWKSLERKTLLAGSMKRDLLYMISTPLAQVSLFLKRAISPTKSA